jgi:hypothetical protein
VTEGAAAGRTEVLATLARLYVGDLDRSLPLLRELTGGPPALRFTLRPGVEIAVLGRFLVIAGSADELEPLRRTQATVVVSSLAGVRGLLEAHGASLLRGPAEVPTGVALTARHTDGSVVEYVEWRPEVRARAL